MGQARKRGTYEQRVAQAILRKEEEMALAILTNKKNAEEQAKKIEVATQIIKRYQEKSGIYGESI